MNGAAALVVEVDPQRIARRLATGYLDEATDSLDEALDRVGALDARRRRRARSACAATPPTCCRRSSRAASRPTCSPIRRRRTTRSTATCPTACRSTRRHGCASATRRSTSRDRWRRWPRTCARCSTLQAARRGHLRLRQQHPRAGASRPASPTRSTSPASCRSTSGRCSARARARSAGPRSPAIPKTSASPTTRRSRCSPHDEALVRWIRLARERVAFQGLPARILLARLRRARALRPAHQRAGARGPDQGADRHRPRSSRHRLGRVAEPRDRRHARRQRCDRRLADPERAAERVERRDLGVGPSRRRRRHRLLAARRHGDRRRRHDRCRRKARARADLRSRASAWCGTPTPAIPRRSPPPSAKACEFRCVRNANADSSYHPGAPRHRGARRLAVAHSRCSLGGCGSGRTTLLQQLRDRLGRTAAQYIDVERTATTPERFLRAVTAVSPFPVSRSRRRRRGRRARAAFDATLALLRARAHRRRASRRRSCSTSSSSCARSRASPACAACCTTASTAWPRAATASC